MIALRRWPVAAAVALLLLLGACGDQQSASDISHRFFPMSSTP